jgi:hypothetical protein
MVTQLIALTRGPLRWVFRSAILVWALSLPAAQAENACGAMASLRNPNAMNGGIGGTGAPARINKLPGESVAGRPGIGGTGAAEGGIGGTGIIGVITGFASICVNGVEVHYDTGTPVLADGQPTTLSNLAVGQVVAVQAVGEGDQLSARSISVMHMVVGPVGRIDTGAGQLQVLGQSVRVADKTVLKGLQTGHWIQVSGYRLLSGELVASQVEPISPRAQAQVVGQMGVASSSGFELHGAKVDLGGLRLSADAVSGTEVSVRGRWDGAILHAQAVTLEPSRQSLGQVDRVVLEGYVHALNGNQVSLGNRVVTLAPDVRISAKPGEALAVNQRVQISGPVDKNRRVVADRVNVRSGVSDAQTKQRLDKDVNDDRKTDDKGGLDSASDGSGSKSDDGGLSGSGSSGPSGSSGSGSGSGTSGSPGSGTSGSSGSGSSGSSGSSGKGSSGGGSSGGGKK